MSILIKGMEMPTDAPVIIKICPDGSVSRVHEGVVAKAVSVPLHGRCIDVDALIKSLSLDEDDAENGASLLMAIFIEVLKAAPTIIQTEDRRYKPSVCMFAEQHREPNHFCADGEKREESE